MWTEPERFFTCLIALLAVSACAWAETRRYPKDSRAVTLALLEGRRMSEQHAESLEENLKADPNDLTSRTKLLGYYLGRAIKSKSDAARKARRSHILWIVRHRPDATIAEDVAIQLSVWEEDWQAYGEGKRLWLAHIEKQKRNTKLLGNAAKFFFTKDKDLAEKLLKRAKQVEPENAAWPEKLGFLYELRYRDLEGNQRQALALKTLKEFEEALSLTEGSTGRYNVLLHLPEAAFYAQQFDSACNFSVKLLDQAHELDEELQPAGIWSYVDAINRANVILGRVAVRRGQLDNAKQFLLRAAKIKGTGTFFPGPDTELAQELLEGGQRAAVLEYVNLCTKVWTDQRNLQSLNRWTALIKAGETRVFPSATASDMDRTRVAPKTQPGASISWPQAPGSRAARKIDAPLASWIKLDGSADDWADKTPLIQEAGAPGRGDFNEIDVKEVYFANDQNYLYVFLRCSPSVQERFAEKQRSGTLCNLYFDVDNDLTTGCRNAVGFDYGKISGYEAKLLIYLGVQMKVNLWTRQAKMTFYVAYDAFGLDSNDGFSSESAVGGRLWEIYDEHWPIKDGPDGVELAVPLTDLGLKPDQVVRLLLAESAHIFDKEGYTSAVLKLR